MFKLPAIAIKALKAVGLYKQSELPVVDLKTAFEQAFSDAYDTGWGKWFGDKDKNAKVQQILESATPEQRAELILSPIPYHVLNYNEGADQMPGSGRANYLSVMSLGMGKGSESMFSILINALPDNALPQAMASTETIRGDTLAWSIINWMPGAVGPFLNRLSNQGSLLWQELTKLPPNGGGSALQRAATLASSGGSENVRTFGTILNSFTADSKLTILNHQEAAAHVIQMGGGESARNPSFTIFQSIINNMYGGFETAGAVFLERLCGSLSGNELCAVLTEPNSSGQNAIQLSWTWADDAQKLRAGEPTKFETLVHAVETAKDNGRLNDEQYYGLQKEFKTTMRSMLVAAATVEAQEAPNDPLAGYVPRVFAASRGARDLLLNDLMNTPSALSLPNEATGQKERVSDDILIKMANFAKRVMSKGFQLTPNY